MNTEENWVVSNDFTKKMKVIKCNYCNKEREVSNLEYEVLGWYQTLDKAQLISQRNLLFLNGYPFLDLTEAINENNKINIRKINR